MQSDKQTFDTTTFDASAHVCVSYFFCWRKVDARLILFILQRNGKRRNLHIQIEWQTVIILHSVMFFSYERAGTVEREEPNSGFDNGEPLYVIFKGKPTCLGVSRFQCGYPKKLKKILARETFGERQKVSGC